MQWLIALAVVVLSVVAPHLLVPGALPEAIEALQPLVAGLLGGLMAGARKR